MTRYAEGTSVPVAKSKGELEQQLTRFGAVQFAAGWDETHGMIAFVFRDRQIRFKLPLPKAGDDEFWRTPTGRRRGAAEAKRAYEQEVRRRWRALCLVVKAKLEAVESGITSFEDEFLAWTALPMGTVGEVIAGQIEQAYAANRVPQLLPENRRAIEATSSTLLPVLTVDKQAGQHSH